MKKLILISFALVFLFTGISKAQQTPVINELSYDARFYNPAAYGQGFVGIFYNQKFLDLDIDHAPKTYQLSLDLSHWLNLSQKRIGLGIGLMSDKEHLQTNNKADLFFAYHLVNESNLKISAGIIAGLLSKRIEFGDSRVNHIDDVVMFSGDKSKAVFNGGFGLQIQTNPGERKGLNFNVVLPQLYTSDLEFDSLLSYELNPHILGGLSYHFALGGIGLEPAVFYRDMWGGKKQKAGNIDLNLRFHFLENRFSIGGGYRLDANTINGSFGIQAGQKLRFFGTYEAHNELGGSFEFGGIYSFGADEPVASSGDKALNNELEKIESLVSKSMQGVATYHKKATASYLKAFNYFEEIKGKDLSIEKNKTKLENAENALEDTYQKVEQIRSEYSNIRTLSRNAEDLLNHNGALKKDGKAIRSIREKKVESNELFQDIEPKYENLKLDIKNWSNETAFDTPTEGLSPKNDLAVLETQLQSEIENLTDKPKTLEVKVKANEQNVEVTYHMENDQENWHLDEMHSMNTLAQLALDNIIGFKKQDLEIVSVEIWSTLKAASTSLQTEVDLLYSTKEPSKKVDITHNIFGEDSTSDKAFQINPGQLNQEKLVVLKMNSLKEFILAKTKVPVVLKMTTNNANQLFKEVYSIQVVVK